MNRKGRLIPHFREPRKVRPPEGVIFLPDGSVDVKNISGTAEASPNIEEMHRSSKQGAFLLVDIGSILLR